MKKSNLFNILCSLLIGVLFMIALMLVFIASGMVSFNKPTLVFESGSTTSVYDGKALINETWTMKSGVLEEGHRASVSVTGSQTNVGESENTMQVRILDSTDSDVTSQYNIGYEFGTLKITPRAISITSASAEKVYDGEPLTNSENTVSEDLAEGHNIIVLVTGSITQVGQEFNTISSVVITDKQGQDVSGNYNMTLREGTLRIIDPAAKSPDGETVLYSIYGDYSGFVYLGGSTFGSFTGKSWVSSEKYPKLIEGTYAASYLTSYALRASNAPKHHMQIKPVSSIYALPYYMDMDTSGYDVQKNDTFYTGSYTTYELDYYLFNQYPVHDSEEIMAYEREYSAFVHENYLDLYNDETAAFLKELIEEEGFTAEDPEIIEKVAEYIQGAGEYSTEYNRELDSAENIVIAFLRDYKEGICKHYASSAVMLYRALGIPARYATGYAAYLQAGKWVSIFPEDAHAWAEVYVDGMGWKLVEVTGGQSDMGSVDNTIELTPVTVEKKYDGTTLYAEQSVKGLEKYLSQGFTYKVVISGEQTEIGICNSIIESFELYAPNGNNVTSDFVFIFNYGKVHVYETEISFTSTNSTSEYGGTVSTEIFKTEGEFLEEGHRAVAISTTETQAGIQLNLFDVIVYDENGKDVTYFYKINKTYGVVNVARKKITLKAGDAEKVYDGTPLTSEVVELIEGELLPGDTIKLTSTEGSQTNVGTAENIITAVSIYNKNKENVTRNYEIQLVSGTLTVTKE
ncbi:MAG: transglutaminase domain-containing protein [Clostridia bacterium]|nr:transglutaminase domain-containing protein [Clostridia bacterium]